MSIKQSKCSDSGIVDGIGFNPLMKDDRGSAMTWPTYNKPVNDYQCAPQFFQISVYHLELVRRTLFTFLCSLGGSLGSCFPMRWLIGEAITSCLPGYEHCFFSSLFIATNSAFKSDDISPIYGKLLAAWWPGFGFTNSWVWVNQRHME